MSNHSRSEYRQFIYKKYHKETKCNSIGSVKKIFKSIVVSKKAINEQRESWDCCDLLINFLKLVD